MIDEGGSGTKRLYSLTSALTRGGNQGLSFLKAAGAGQSFMQPVGNSLYFANGVQNKKWLTSLFTRTASGNSTFLQGVDGLAGTYPFGTFMIDPATGNPQEFIGISVGVVTHVTVAAGVLSLTVAFTSDTRDYDVGTSFQLWGLTGGSNTWLNGFTITLTSKYDHTLLGRKLVGSAEGHADYTVAEAGQAFVIQAGTTPVIARTGGSVPTWGTVKPAIANNFMGSLTLDGNTVWINRGVDYADGNQPSVENWGIKAPLTAPVIGASGSAVAWQKNTYYSATSIFIDPLHGNLWQITTPGLLGSSQPAWPSSPTKRQKVVISSVYSDGVNIFFTTDTQSPALVAGDTVVLKNMCTLGPGNGSFPNLNGVQLTVDATGLSTTGFRAAYTANTIGTSAHPYMEYGQAIKTLGTNPPTTLADGNAVWTCIQLAASLTWQAATHYNVDDFIVSPNGFVFQLGPQTSPFITDTVTLESVGQPNSHQNSEWQGANFYYNSADPVSHTGFPNWPPGGSSTQTPNSLWLQRSLPPGSGDVNTPFAKKTINGAGQNGAQANLSSVTSSWIGSLTTRIFIPKAGTYTFTLQHNDGMFFSFDSQRVNLDTVIGGAYKQSGPKNNVPQTITPKMGYGKAGGGDLAGNNNSGRTGPGPFGETANTPADTVTWSFPQAGAYAVEIAFAKWYHSGGFAIFSCPGTTGTPKQTIAIGRNISGSTAPVWPPFTTSGAGWDSVNEVIKWGGKVTEVATAGSQYTWNNVGPTTDFVWSAGIFYTLPGTGIIDTNGNEQFAYETGISGTVQPTWTNTTVGSILAVTNVPLSFINAGSIAASTTVGDTITATSQQGWLYWIALVNTLDQTVSNVGPVSLPTGPINKGQISFAPGAGLDIASIDPQADYVAIFRSADGFTTPLLIPGFVNSPYTVPLAQYLRNGYVDTLPDSELNNLVQGAQALENTPPPLGAQNLSYHLSRIWFSVGNTVYWTTGPLSPIGNGTDGFAPGNFATCPSQIKRLVPTAIGMLVFTVSDIYIIAGNGTTTNPILPAIPYLTGVGIGSYNAIDINGGLLGFFTTDKQFVLFDPSAGLHYVGFNIGDQFRKNNGQPGTSWNPSNVYVAWHINGEDQAWYVADGTNGWFKLIATPAPEQGSVSWSPFASIQGGAGAIKSVETEPGVHNLLVGQTGATSVILSRNLDATTDGGSGISNGTPYAAYGVMGSIVLAQPGQIAKIAFMTTDSVKVGSPLILGAIFDEALPYFTGSFDILKNWVTDPPGLPESTSILSQRFYVAEDEQSSAYCKHLQVLFQWPAEAAQNELQTFTIYGAYEVEQ
jgi:hypothetical protein